MRSKFNVRTDSAGKLARTYAGALYDSMAEARYAAELDLLLLAKIIRAWKRQSAFSLSVNDIFIGDHIVDFVVTTPNNRTEVHEVKGHETALWKWKRKHFEAQYPHIKYVVVKR